MHFLNYMLNINIQINFPNFLNRISQSTIYNSINTDIKIISKNLKKKKNERKRKFKIKIKIRRGKDNTISYSGSILLYRYIYVYISFLSFFSLRKYVYLFATHYYLILARGRSLIVPATSNK